MSLQLHQPNLQQSKLHGRSEFAAHEFDSAKNTALANRTEGRFKKSLFAYGVASYAIGVSSLVALILVTLDVLPVTGGPVQLSSRTSKIVFNLGLILLFGIQHAIMARPAFKRRWTTIIPNAIERSTFVLITGFVMGTLVWLWQPLPDLIWNADGGALRAIFLAGCALGWGYMLLASFAIDHFELFGLRQVWDHMRGNASKGPSFKTRLMYRFDRHPIMTGVLVGLWVTPNMTLGRFVLALGFSAYIVVGVAMEESDLRRKHGSSYRSYASKVRTIVPPLRRR